MDKSFWMTWARIVLMVGGGIGLFYLIMALGTVGEWCTEHHPWIALPALFVVVTGLIALVVWIAK